MTVHRYNGLSHSDERRTARNCSRPARRLGLIPICGDISASRFAHSQSELKHWIAPKIEALDLYGFMLSRAISSWSPEIY